MDRRRVGASGDARAIAKKADLFHFRGAVRLHLVAAFLDAQSAVMVPFRNVGHIEATFDVDIGVVLAHPGPQCA